MKLFRYRKPSLKTIVGITKVKKSVKRSLGISQVERWTKPSRLKQRAFYHVGWYKFPIFTFYRQTIRDGKVRGPSGFFTKVMK
ncbi:hypothetical protein KBC79_02090 [Candidatus Woesebacteria bacterium]|nr:hypothetical protein [Candidatus Woesebacteria bacterium]